MNEDNKLRLLARLEGFRDNMHEFDEEEMDYLIYLCKLDLKFFTAYK